MYLGTALVGICIHHLCCHRFSTADSIYAHYNILHCLSKKCSLTEVQQNKEEYAANIKKILNDDDDNTYPFYRFLQRLDKKGAELN